MNKDIKTLLERFMAGLTSVEEEQTLAEFFRNHDVSDELKPYKAMFAWFDDGMPYKDKKEIKRKHLNRYIITMASVAAAIAVILSVVFGQQGENIPAESIIQDIQATCRMPEPKSEEAVKYVAATEQPVNETPQQAEIKNVNNTSKRDILLAKSRKDSIMIQGEKLANKALEEIYHAQEAALHDLRMQFEQQDQDINIRLAAMTEEVNKETDRYIYY